MGDFSQSEAVGRAQSTEPSLRKEGADAPSGIMDYVGLSTLLESLLANAPVGFALLDENLRLVCLNQTFSAMTGFSPLQQLGLPFEDLVPAAVFLKPGLKNLLERGKSIIEHELALRKSTVAELSRYAQVSFYPLPDGSGKICGIALLAVDITDRKRADQRLKKVSDELIRSNDALEAFCSIASHDLNEPLRTLSSFVKLLEGQLKGKLNQQAKEYMEFIAQGAGRMRSLIDGILKYARSGKQELDFSDVDCAKILLIVLDNLKVAIEECHATITHDPLPMVYGDPLILSQTFQNILANALKYRGPNPCQIHIGVRSDRDRWVFSITDNGIGIDPKYLSYIFAPFRKLHTQDKYAGVGLGLAICQKNVEQLGGSLRAKSEEGKGSVFSFTVPKVSAEKRPKP
jgi:PAS domain S-box-containing protein